MALTRYLGWILLPILIWSLGGAWIEGFTKSHFQHELVLDSSKATGNGITQTSTADAAIHTPPPTPPAPDPFAKDNAKYRFKNSLNSTHYMLYHELQPAGQSFEPFTFGFLTSTARLEGLMKRKKQMAVTFIGGSVTAAYCKEPGIGCWVTPVSDWLLQENPQMQISNSAIGGITSSTASQCFDAMVNPTSDLVLIEFSLNDRFIPPEHQIKGYEQLLRRLLRLPHQPAVVIVHWWSPVHDCSESQQISTSATLPRGTIPCIQKLWNTTEDHIQRLVKHYNVHSVSFRNNFWSEIDAEAEGFTPDQLFMRDEIHPSGRGVGLLGGLVIEALQGALKKALTQGFQELPKENTPVPAPLYVSASDDAKVSQCNRGGALQDMVLYNYGWRWLEGKKPGFQTDDILTSLFLSVPMESTSSDQLSVGYLSSYENMGIARVTCLGACQCDEFDIDASSKAHASQEHHALIPFQHSGDSKGCILKFDNMNLTNAVNQGHRFKVSSVAVAERAVARLSL